MSYMRNEFEIGTEYEREFSADDYYDYPSSHLDIWCPAEANYFVCSDKFTYLCTYEEMKMVNPWKDFHDSYIISIYKRYAIIKDGKILFINNNFNDGHEPEKYCKGEFFVMSNRTHLHCIKSWNKFMATFFIYEEDASGGNDGSLIFNSPNDAMQFAQKISRESEEIFMVIQQYASYDRH